MQLPSGGSPEFETSTTNPETFSVGPNAFVDLTIPVALAVTAIVVGLLALLYKKHF